MILRRVLGGESGGFAKLSRYWRPGDKYGGEKKSVVPLTFYIKKK